ncbi:MAG: diaminopimelate epimerase [Bacteroidetes bacterium]|nr:diaminopimelate epimerase [Bacteroidota bacterium]
MITDFYKYHGSGNDFIIVDDFDNKIEKSVKNIQKHINHLCNRRLGIGADGLMFLQNSKTADFKMKFYNSDGKVGTMCGNGGRCIAAFAYMKGYAEKTMKFEAIDGIHNAEIINDEVNLKMSDIEGYKRFGNSIFLDTGSPHYVQFVKDAASIDVIRKGRKIRHDDNINPGGTNVNFVEIQKDALFVRTFERGVEDETLSCGTGVVASAVASFIRGFIKPEYKIKTLGGNLKVKFTSNAETGQIEDVWLKGPAVLVFKGMLDLA